MSELIIESAKYGKFVVLYDEADAALVNEHTWHIHKMGGTFYVEAHTCDGNGKQTTLCMHRLLTAAPPGMMVDHINHCGWDNRHFNLRSCTNKENQQNRLKQKTKASSQYKGVHWHKAANKWQAYITIDSKRKYLGLFSDESEAAKAYDAAAKIHHKQFAVLNFPPDIS